MSPFLIMCNYAELEYILTKGLWYAILIMS